MISQKATEETKGRDWTTLQLALVLLLAAFMGVAAADVDLVFQGVPIGYRDFKLEWTTNVAGAWEWYADIHATNRSDKLKITVDADVTNGTDHEFWRVREVTPGL